MRGALRDVFLHVCQDAEGISPIKFGAEFSGFFDLLPRAQRLPGWSLMNLSKIITLMF